jgi:hypothetical protein
MKRDRERTLGGFRPPRLPDDLERRVLDAAGRVFDDPARPTLWDRLWTSTPLRAVWVVTTGALMVAHVVLSLPTDPRTRTDRSTTSADATVPEDLREIFRLPQMEISPRAARLCLGASRRPPVETDNDKSKDTEDAS